MEQKKITLSANEKIHRVDILLGMLKSPETPIDKILKQLDMLPEMSNALLNRANSSEFALKHQIERVSHAIAVLGMQRAVQTVSQSASRTAPPAPKIPIQGTTEAFDNMSSV
ncbi:MAG: HDOD domain-containing protein [Pirellulaceae bacterium]|nr:HDOD domain-containing protein [Pirellulaceae bacterium]